MSATLFQRIPSAGSLKPPALRSASTCSDPSDMQRKRHIDDAAWYMETALSICVALALLSAVWRDGRIGGLGSSNGRIVSFLASLNSAVGFRRQKRAVAADATSTRRKSVVKRRLGLLHLGAPTTSVGHKLSLFLVVFANKFGTQSLGSVMVGATPVILRGPRHLASWFVAFAVVQLAPGDVAYDSVERHVFLKLVVKGGAALYKLRKFNFVVGACDDCGYGFMLLAMLVVIDGNNFCSRLSTWTMFRGRGGTRASDVAFGLYSFAKRSLPVALAASLARCCGAQGTLFEVQPELTVFMRILVLIVFLLRNDCFGLAWRTGKSALRCFANGSEPPRKRADSESFITTIKLD